jgi:hypothetical protein
MGQPGCLDHAGVTCARDDAGRLHETPADGHLVTQPRDRFTVGVNQRDLAVAKLDARPQRPRNVRTKCPYRSTKQSTPVRG